MTFTIDGLNVLPYIAAGGIKWTRSDVESSDAGRTLDGIMHRGRVATKIRLDVTTLPLTTERIKTLLNAIQPEFVTVTYDDPYYGGVVTRTMYSNNIPATCLTVYDDGTELWDGVSFPLIEQ